MFVSKIVYIILYYVKFYTLNVTASILHDSDIFIAYSVSLIA